MIKLFFVVFVLWMVFVTHFLYLLIKYKLDTDKILLWYKNKLLFKKDEVNNIQQEPSIKKTETVKKENITDLDDEDCKHPTGFPLDLCLSDNLTEEEKYIRQQILNKLKNEPAYFYENGQKKLIVPLEVLVFLNKDLNPLVNEYGEIILSIKEEKIDQDFKDLIIAIKDSNEILYKNDEELIQNIKVFFEAMKKSQTSLEEATDLINNYKELQKIQNTQQGIEKEAGIQEVETSNNIEEITKKDEVKTGNKEMVKEEEAQEQQTNKNIDESIKNEDKIIDENIESKEDTKSQETDLMKQLQMEMKNEIQIDKETQEKQVNKNIKNKDIEDTELQDSQIDLMKQLQMEMENEEPQQNTEVETEPTKEETPQSEKEALKTFLHNLPWKTVDKTLDFKGISLSIKELFNSKENISALANNIVKQHPLVFNDNKTAVFVDSKIINVAIARLFGADADTILKKIDKLYNIPNGQYSYQNSIAEVLSEYISDLVNPEKKFAPSYFLEDGHVCLKGYGLWFKTTFFELCLDDEYFPLFRSFSLANNIKVASNQANCNTPLVKDTKSTII